MSQSLSRCKIKLHQHAVILASDAGSEQDAQEMAGSSGVGIFSAEVVLFM